MKQGPKGGVGMAFRRQYGTLVTKSYGNSNSSLKVIAVAGAHGTIAAAHYLRDLLTENEQSVLVFEPSAHATLTIRRTQMFLRQARKDNTQYVIIVLNDQAIRRHVLGSVPLEAVIVTDSNYELLPTLNLLLDTRPKFIILNRDDHGYDELAEKEATAQTISYGKHEEADARIAKTKFYRKGSELQLVVDHQTKLNLATYLVGETNLYSLASAVTTLYVMGENIHRVDEGAAQLESLPGNYEYLAVPRPYSVVLDNAIDDKALIEAVSTAKLLTKRRLIVVTQTDIISPETIEHVAGIADRLIVIDINDEIPNRGTIERVVSPDGAIKVALRTARQEDTVLLAGPVFAQRDENGRSYAAVTIEHSL